jgi:hypothetical protein
MKPAPVIVKKPEKSLVGSNAHLMGSEARDSVRILTVHPH